MKKIESLKKLREVVEGLYELAHGTYYVASSKCNCVIGHLLKMESVTDKQLKAIDNNYYCDGAYHIKATIEASLEGRVEDDFVKRALESLGFDLKQDVDMLQELQQVNDQTDGSVSAVIFKIDNIIQNLEKPSEF